MALFSSPPDLSGLSDQDLRDSLLARGLLVRNLFTALQLRGQLASVLLHRAATGGIAPAPQAWMEALHATWVLTENLLAAFELLADPDQFDARLSDCRKAAWSRSRNRSARKRGKFVKKSWGYHIINTPALDDLYKERGLTVDRGRAAALGLTTRSAEYLETTLESLQAFHGRYDDTCTSFKHGRRLFRLAVTVERGPSGGVTRLNLKRDEDVVTAITHDGTTARLAELRVDDELMSEIASTLATVRHLVDRQATRWVQMLSLVEAFIAHRGGTGTADLGVITALTVFVEPETADERLLYYGATEGDV